MRKVLAILSIAGLVIMACGGGGAGSPEDAVQGYLDAMKSGDIDGMMQYMPESEREEMTDEEKEMAEEALSFMSAIEFKIISSAIDGEEAVVTLEINFMGQVEEQEVELFMENGKWVIAEGVI